MKSVLISIRPKCVEKIANGQKTIEVRKTAPKCEVPFKVYIYCTKHSKQFFHNGIGEKECLFKNPDTGKIKFDYAFEVMCCKNDYSKDNFLSGKVIGEFICNRIDVFTPSEHGIIFKRFRALYETRLTVDEMRKYAKGKTLYGWNISDLKIYDRPKELSEFKKTKEKIAMTCGMQARNGLCRAIDHEELCDNIKCCFKTPRPSQSWCYVEELEK